MNTSLLLYDFPPLSLSSSSSFQCVTILQLSQMFVGIFINLVSWSIARTGQPCMFRYDLFYLAAVMYGSYAVLFSNFFYQRYLNKSPSKSKSWKGSS